VGDQPSLSRSQQREQFWRRIVSGQPRSGMSVVAWCGEHGVSAPSFYVWRQRLAKRAAERKLRRSQLLPVEIVASAADKSVAPVEIELPSRARVHVRPGCDLELLRQVLLTLQQDSREAEGC
jgi:hypothetical protein